MKKKSNIILTVLFFGALWGLLEASLGYVLHFLPTLIAGGIMFPIGAVLMFWAYQNTKSKSTIIYVGLIAAAIKSINFFMPGLAVIRTYHPMMSIILQSLVVLMMVPLFERKPLVTKVSSIFLASFSWRTLFVGLAASTYALTGIFSTQLTNINTFLSFVFTNAVVEIALLLVVFLSVKLAGQKTKLTFIPQWSLSLATLALAIAVRLIPVLLG